MTNHDEFDGLLHEALGEYREAEPLAGIESRILSRIAQPETRRNRFVLRWAIALACAAAIAAAVWFGIGRRTPRPAPPSEAAAIQPAENAPVPTHAPVAVASAPDTAEVRKAASRTAPQSTHTQTATQVKPAVFPSPAPLTAEERAFLAALNQSPSTMTVASEPEKPITIAEIEIKPLVLGGLPTSASSGENQ